MRKSVANIITLINLFVGSVAIILVFNGQFIYAFWAIVFCGVADILDGYVARLLGSDSELGLQLDSLADVVSFGVVPGAILYQLLHYALDDSSWWAYLGFIFTIFAALRLAHFNVQEDSSGDFTGLPTPAATGFVAGLLLIHQLHPSFSSNVLLNPILLFSIVVLLSLLMVSKFWMFSLKFKGKGWKGNEWRYSLIIVSILLFIFIQEWAFSAIILVYIISSLLKHFISKNEVHSTN